MSAKVFSAINSLNKQGHHSRVYRHQYKVWVEIDQCMLASLMKSKKHAAEIGRVFADANAKELQILESVLKKAGKRARALAERRSKQD